MDPSSPCVRRAGKFLVAVAFLSIATSFARAENRLIDLTLIGGGYGAPLRPSELANWIDDGFAFRGQIDVKPVRVLAFCIGAERMRFYRPHEYSFMAGTVDLGGKLILPAFLGGVGYLQGGVGLNVLGDRDHTWGGKTCGRLILGKRIPVVPGFGFDLAAGYHMMGKPEAFKYADVRAGVVLGIGRDKDPRGQGTPTATPVSGSPTPAVTAVPAKGSPTPMNVPTATPTTDVISLEGETPPTFTPTATLPAGAVTLTLADRTMKETYDAAYRAYRAGRYPEAIRLWKKAIAIKDATKFWYYAEANAMIGATYHYKMNPPNKTLARQYYRAALKIDPATKTAKRGLAKLAPAPRPKPKPKPAAKPQDDLSDEALGLQPASSPAK